MLAHHIPEAQQLTTPTLESYIHISAHSELQPGSTGIVHIGTMTVDLPGPTVKVVIKLAFSRNEKESLANEHHIYSQLHFRHVQGIPQIFNLLMSMRHLVLTTKDHISYLHHQKGHNILR
jgi:hypothetical protein